ncbi:MAG: sigma-70 family RNA polymerase sigma factor [Thermoleophilia bacterium]|nr:sigma-70 family RNA polymerase sigma factor [Thermoleophilia bacterium]
MEGARERLDLAALAPSLAPRLFRFARSLTRDETAAEDLVQETFARALERAPSYRGEASPEAWLRRILHNLAVDRSRRLERETLVAEVGELEVEERWRDDSYTVDPAVVAARAETREELEDALVRLPFDQRVAVVLHDIEGWTVKEIADAVGIGLAAAKQRLRRGRMALVSALARGAERREALAGVPLRCWDARRLVSDYLDGELAAKERRALERHLETCPTCPPLYTSLVGVRDALGALRDPDSVVPPGLAARIVERIEARDD